MWTERFKVVYQCSSCENPIRDGDKYVKTKYGYFCDDCFEIGYAKYQEEKPTLDEMFAESLAQLDKLSIWG